MRRRLPVAEGEELALTHTGQAGESNEVPIWLDRVSGESFDLRPIEEAHLRSLSVRRPDAEDRLVDHLPALVRAAQDHLERVEHQLR